DSLENSPYNLFVALVDLQIEQLVPDIQALGIGGYETFEYRPPTLRRSVCGLEFQGGKLEGQREVCVRWERLNSSW
ncbi:hypothetical protein NQU36_29050, partial [Escherichia coli]|uniref:hypothetical protein n=1 Tax=Escherichia coli TaxID=562 RepID=UPI0021178C43